MSLQMEAPNAGGIAGFWNSITGTRSRRAEPPPRATPIRRDPVPDIGRLPIRAKNLAEKQIERRRPLLEAETLADCYIKNLAADDYAYRLLKDEFDEVCEQAEIAPVSDKRFAGWLASHGARRYRNGYPKITMYMIAPRRSRAAA